MYMYVCVYRNIFFALYSWGILQVSFDIIIIFPSQAVFKILMQPDSRQCLPMVWYNRSTVTGVRAGIVTLYRRCFFHFLKALCRAGRLLPASDKALVKVCLISGEFTASGGQIKVSFLPCFTYRSNDNNNNNSFS